MRKVVRTTDAPRPRGVYSQAIVDGDFVFVAGQGSINPVTNELDLGDIRSETRRTLKNIQAILEARSEEHTSELQSRLHLVCRLLLEKKKKIYTYSRAAGS